MSCKKNRPGIVRRLLNFAKAQARYVRAGMPNVTQEQYDARLAICPTCDQYDHGICRHPQCGCFVSWKAIQATQDCPLKKWPALEIVAPPVSNCTTKHKRMRHATTVERNLATGEPAAVNVSSYCMDCGATWKFSCD